MAANAYGYEEHTSTSVFGQTLDSSFYSNLTIQIIAMMTTLNKEERVRQMPLFLFLGLVSLIGIIGNVLVLYIYIFRCKASNSRSFILCLAIVDLCSCVIGIPLEIVTVWDLNQFASPWTCKMSRFTNAATSTTSASLLVLIATDRFRKICRPFKWQISKDHANYLSVGAICVGLFFSWPSLILKGTKSIEVSLRGNLTGIGTKCSNDDRYSKTLFPLANDFAFLFLFVTSLISLIVLYTLIRQKVRSLAKNKQTGQGDSTDTS